MGPALCDPTSERGEGGTLTRKEKGRLDVVLKPAFRQLRKEARCGIGERANGRQERERLDRNQSAAGSVSHARDQFADRTGEHGGVVSIVRIVGFTLLDKLDPARYRTWATVLYHETSAAAEVRGN